MSQGTEPDQRLASASLELSGRHGEHTPDIDGRGERRQPANGVHFSNENYHLPSHVYNM